MKEQSSNTKRAPPNPYHYPKGTGDDPMQLNNLSNDNDVKDICLEGIPPDRFEGDRNKMVSFLTQFKRFMLMNQ